MERRYMMGDGEVVTRVEATGEVYRVQVGEEAHTVRLIRQDNGALTLDVDGRQQPVVVAAEGGKRWVSVNGVAWALEPAAGRKSKRAGHGGEESLAAQMPGQVLAVYVTPGEHVEKGQRLVLLEAMKMELQVTAPHAGRVRGVRVKPGEIIKRGQTLVDLEQ